MRNVQPTHSRAKYQNNRLALLWIVIFSAINLISPLLLEIYFLFSAYIPQIILSVGYALFAETESTIFLIAAVVLGLLTLVPYLLCWIFSKKHVGWMIAALVMFSLDTAVFLLDFVSYAIMGDLSMLADLIFHAIALIMLILAVKYGFDAKKEDASAPAAEDVAAFSTEAAFDTLPRTVTVTRKKSFVGCAVPIICYINGAEVCRLKNGETKSFTAPGCAFTLNAGFSNGFAASEAISVPAEAFSLSYQVSVKSGMMANRIEITPLA